MPIEIGRRSLLTALLATVAMPAWAQTRIGTLLAMPACSPSGLAEGPRLSFAGGRTILLLLRDTEIDRPAPQAVSPGASIDWSPDFADRFGGEGWLGSGAGNFSGRRHLSADQLFRRWPSVRAGTVQRMFDPAVLRKFGPADADDPATWTVEVDGAPVAVAAVHRKTLPVGSAWTSPRKIATTRRHLVTLRLAGDIAPGAAVRVAARGFGPVAATRDDRLTSELVHVCQAGYALAGPKKGYVGLWLGADRNGAPANSDDLLAEGQPWRLVDAETGATVQDGTLTLVKAADAPHLNELNFNGCSIYQADFTAASTAGRYRLEVAGVGASVPFAVVADPTAALLRLVARWYYHQRSGCAIEAPFGEGRLRPRNGHPEDGLTVWQTDIRLAETSEGVGGEESSALLARQPAETDPAARANPDAWGGWHDAGDWDRRVQHLDAVYMMAHLVENFPTVRSLQANIPESGHPFAHPAIAARKAPDDRGDGQTVLPDLIHEALWGISLWRRTQTAEGGIIGGVEYSSDGIQGSVSWNPLQRAYAYAPDAWSAYRFVMAAAKLGHVIETACGDAVLGAALKSEAVAAWNWAEGLPPPEGEAAVSLAQATLEVRVLAAASLYRATGDAQAAALFERLNPFLPEAGDGAPEIPLAVMGHICFDYARAGQEGRAVKQPIVEAMTNWLRGAYTYGTRLGADYGLHSTDLYPPSVGWYRFGPGSNWPAGLAALHLMTGGDGAAVTDRVLEGQWFALGCNPSNTCFVNGVGARDFADPLVIDFDAMCPVPGTISIGVAAGPLRDWERDSVAGALYPADDAWPPYTRIWETRRVISCSEFVMRDNVLEWLVGCTLAHELLSRRCAGTAACAP